MLGCYLESLWWAHCNQLVKGGWQELGAVNEAQLPKGKGDILLRVGDTAHPALHLRDGLHQQVTVILAPQVVKHHGDGGGLGV